MSSKEKNEELVVLSFNNTQGGSNWTEFCRLQSRYQIAKYGDFGRFVLDGKHYEEARIQKPVRGEGVDDEEWEMVLSEYKDDRKRQNKSAYARLLLRSASYAELMSYISQQIKDLLERDLDWEGRTLPDGTKVVGVNTEMDPVRLLALAKKVVGTGLYGSMATDKYTVMSRYQACRQGNVELADYQRTFRDQLSYLRAVGYTEVMVPESDVAMQYIQSLNSQFQGWRDELAKLTLAFKESKYPSTLSEAMATSVSYAKIVAGSSAAKESGKPVFAMEEAGRAEEPEFCMVMGPNPKYKPKRGDYDDKGDISRGDPVTVKIPREVLESQTINEGDTRSCRSCGAVGHIWKQCAVRIFKEEQKKAHGPDTVFCMGASVVRGNSTRGPGGNEEDNYHVESHRRNDETSNLTRTAIRAAGAMHLAMTTVKTEPASGGRLREETLKLFAAAKMGPNMAGLDTMSALCGTANRNLVKGARSGRNLQLFGIGGVCDVTEAGRLLDTEIDMWVFPEGYPTILCFHDIWSKYGIEFDCVRNQFDTTIMGVKLHFKPCETDEKVYMADISELLFRSGSESEHTGFNEAAARRSELYTKAEAKDADMALYYSKRVGEPLNVGLVNMSSSGNIMDCPSVAAKTEVSKKTQSDQVWEAELVDRVAPRDLKIWVDIMLVDGAPALISVSGAAKLLQLTWLKDQDCETAKIQLKKHMERLTREGFRVTGMHTDGDGGAIKNADDDIPARCVRTKGQPASKAEAQIRTARWGTRGTLATQSYHLIVILLIWLLLFLVPERRPITSQSVSHLKAVHGRIVSHEMGLDLNFGDNHALREFDEARTVANRGPMSMMNSAAVVELGLSEDPMHMGMKAVTTFEELNSPSGEELDEGPTQADAAVEELHGELTSLHCGNITAEQCTDHTEPEGVSCGGFSWKGIEKAEATPKGRLCGTQIGVSDASAPLGTLEIGGITKEAVGSREAVCMREVRRSEFSYMQRRKKIKSLRFLKENYLPSGEFDNPKADHVAVIPLQHCTNYFCSDMCSPSMTWDAPCRLVEFHKFWCDELSGFLASEGFDANANQRCEVKMMHGEDLKIISCDVDNLMVTCRNGGGVSRIFQREKEKFKDPTIDGGTISSYPEQTADSETRAKVKTIVAGELADPPLCPIMRRATAVGDALTVGDEEKLQIDADDVIQSTVMKSQCPARSSRPVAHTVMMLGRNLDVDMRHKRFFRCLLAEGTRGTRLVDKAGTVGRWEATDCVDANNGDCKGLE